MYCPECKLNWKYVPGKRYFRTWPAVLRCKSVRSCPTCAENPNEVLARHGLYLVQRISNGNSHSASSFKLNATGFIERSFREKRNRHGLTNEILRLRKAVSA